MRGICFLIKNEIFAQDNGERAVFSAFRAGGYLFDELRVLSKLDESVKLALTTAKKEFDYILLLAPKALLRVAGEYLSQFSRENSYMGAGIYAEKEKTVLLLSADETETGAPYANGVCLSYLRQKYGARYEEICVRAVGASLTRVQAVLANIERFSEGKLRVRHIRLYDEDVVRVFYDNATPKMVVDEALRMLAEGLENTAYALTDVSLEEQLVTLLKVRGKKLSVAESFTGGGIAKRITSVSGASEVYFEGVNTYAEESKIKRLGVSEYGLRTTGAVSDQTAYEMALGLLNTGDCDIAIATTGLAGPKSDKSMLPVGLCYVAVGTKEKIFVYRYKLDGSRAEITEKAINYALFLAYKQLKSI